MLRGKNRQGKRKSKSHIKATSIRHELVIFRQVHAFFTKRASVAGVGYRRCNRLVTPPVFLRRHKRSLIKKRVKSTKNIIFVELLCLVRYSVENVLSY